MNNLFISHGFDWNGSGSRKVRAANEVLGRFGISARLSHPGSTGYMTSVEQRMNVYHLVSQVLAYGVEGDLVEIGTFTGQTATIIGRVMAGEGKAGTGASPDGGGKRALHVYDSFASGWSEPDPRGALERNFREVGLPVPEIHGGLFSETIPRDLPDKIAFAHIDTGSGGSYQQHCDVLCHVFAHVYPRMTRGAVASLIDFWDPAVHTTEVHDNHGVAMACEKFFADKPERVSALYAGFYTHGYFRKQ